MSLQKSPLVNLLIILLLADTFFRNGFSKKNILITTVLICFLIILMYLFFMGDIKRSSFVTASGIGRRIFLGQIVPFYFYLLFQEQFGYMGIGSFFPNPGGMLPFEPISYTTIIMKFATGSDGSMPTVFFGQWFISFGPLMSLLSMLIMGFILQFVDILFISKLNKCKSLLLSTMFILVIQYMGGFVETGNSGILIDPRWIMPGFFLSIIYLSILTLKKIANKNTTKHNLVNPY